MLPPGRKPLGNDWYNQKVSTHENSVRSMKKHREFMKNTCPASRHAQIIAESLFENGKYDMLEEDPKHCASSIASTVDSLYQARTFLQNLGYDWKVLENGDVEWYAGDDNDTGWYEGRASRNNMSNPGNRNYED